MKGTKNGAAVCPSGIPVNRFPRDSGSANGMYYHYTSLSTLWKILESETLFATNARFSNDSAEIERGTEIMDKVIKKVAAKGGMVKAQMDHLNYRLRGADADLDENKIDCYIVCFCGKDDILSQWRGYCREDGVSIGFAVDQNTKYYLIGPKLSEKGTRSKTVDPETFKLKRVWYVYGDKDHTPVRGPAKNQAAKGEGKLIKTLSDGLLEKCKLNDEQFSLHYINETIPLIKHAGFIEEDEYRLLISNCRSCQGGTKAFPLDEYVDYIESDGVRKPHLTVCFSPDFPDTGTSEVRVGILFRGVSENSSNEIFSALERALACIGGKKIKYEKLIQDSFNPEIVIGVAPENIQRAIFAAIDSDLASRRVPQADRSSPQIKLWCDGHPPIRSIRVSPCANQDEIMESIRHYCIHNKFWMKYVDVIGSSIPYRRPK